jgi:hypothetical protein
MDHTSDEVVAAVHQQPTPPPSDSHVPASTNTHIADDQNVKRMDVDEETVGPDMLSPMSADADKQDESELPALTSTDLGSPSGGYDFSNIRVRLLSPAIISSTPVC